VIRAKEVAEVLAPESARRELGCLWFEPEVDGGGDMHRNRLAVLPHRFVSVLLQSFRGGIAQGRGPESSFMGVTSPAVPSSASITKFPLSNSRRFPAPLRLRTQAL